MTNSSLTFWNFLEFFACTFLNNFNLESVESTDAEPVDTEGGYSA